MKKLFLPILVFVSTGMMSFSHENETQTIYTIVGSKNICMKLSGTTTLRQWIIDTQTFTGEAQFSFKQNNHQLCAIKYLTFSISLKNFNTDKKTENRYKDIFYTLIYATVLPGKDNQYIIKAVGNLRIASITKEVSIDFYCMVNKDESITCKGSNQLIMKDYFINSPLFMKEAMKTGDALSLDFSMVYKK